MTGNGSVRAKPSLPCRKTATVHAAAVVLRTWWTTRFRTVATCACFGIDPTGSLMPRRPVIPAGSKRQSIERRAMANYRMITHDGRTQSLVDWAQEIGVSYNVLYSRLADGMSVERALTNKSSRSVEFEGRSQSLIKWLDELRITPQEVRAAFAFKRAMSAPGVVKDFDENNRDRRGSVTRDSAEIGNSQMEDSQ